MPEAPVVKGRHCRCRAVLQHKKRSLIPVRCLWQCQDDDAKESFCCLRTVDTSVERHVHERRHTKYNLFVTSAKCMF